ncbi:hypothetical protein DXM21_14475 [Agrobacterium rosae]|nr:hypothetical protein DXM21_14475 [Agrobacterium rosae]
MPVLHRMSEDALDGTISDSMPAIAMTMMAFHRRISHSRSTLGARWRAFARQGTLWASAIDIRPTSLEK